MSNIQRYDDSDTNQRYELERLAGSVTFRRYALPAVTLLETRPATQAETIRYTAWEAASIADGNRTTLLDRAQQALATNAAFLALVSPTAQQVATQVKALTRQDSGLIHLALDKLDDISDT